MSILLNQHDEVYNFKYSLEKNLMLAIIVNMTTMKLIDHISISIYKLVVFGFMYLLELHITFNYIHVSKYTVSFVTFFSSAFRKTCSSENLRC